MDFQTTFQDKRTIIDFQKFILEKFNIQINRSILENQLTNINKEKLNMLDTHFQIIFGLSFQDLFKLSIKQLDKNEYIQDKSSDILINQYLIKMNEKDKKISDLEEANEDLRTNYWNLKQSTLKQSTLKQSTLKQSIYY